MPHYERHRPEQTTLYRLVQQHAAAFFAEVEAAAGTSLPSSIKDEFDAFLEGRGRSTGRSRMNKAQLERLLQR